MGLTDKHLAYGDDIPQTQTEKDYYWTIKQLEEQNNKLKEAIRKIKDEIQNIADDIPFRMSGRDDGRIDGLEEALEIIDKHMEEVSE